MRKKTELEKNMSISEYLIDIMGKENVLVLKPRNHKDKGNIHGGRRGVRIDGLLIGIEKDYSTDIDCFYCLPQTITTFKNEAELFEHLISEHHDGHTEVSS